MRALKSKSHNNGSSIRTLTVQPLYFYNHSQEAVPYLRLRGKWLESLGFKPHQKVKVTTHKRKLIIEVE